MFLEKKEVPPRSFPNKPTKKVVWPFLWSALSIATSGVNLTPLLKHTAALVAYECVHACSHTWREDKFKENTQYQLQTSIAIRKGHPGVFLRCHSLHCVYLPSSFSGAFVHPFPLVCVHLCHFCQVCFSEASATIWFSFPGAWFPRLPPVRFSFSLPSLLQRTLSAAVLFPFVPLKLQNTHANCKIYWSKTGRDWRVRRKNTAAMAQSGSFQNAKWLYRLPQSVICFITAQQTLDLQRLCHLFWEK